MLASKGKPTRDVRVDGVACVVSGVKFEAAPGACMRPLYGRLRSTIYSTLFDPPPPPQIRKSANHAALAA